MATPEPELDGLRRAFALLSAMTLLALAAAWAKDYFTEWRSIQGRYNTLAAGAGKPPVAVGIKQIWKPELELVDRCVTCHLTMGGAGPLPGEPLFKSHPPIPHEPRDFGCTPCHGGQGRATTVSAAHGPTSDWPWPILNRTNTQAGCGTCHTGFKTPSLSLAERGEQLIKEYECLGCHREPQALTTVGMRGLADDWHNRHAGLSENGLTFAPLPEEDVPAVSSALATRMGAPRLMAGKRLVAQLGCRGCHRINGVGGDGEEGPNLDELPRREGLGTAELADWHRAHLLDPQRLVKDSLMPRLGLSEEEAELVTGFLLSLRPRHLPEAQLPIDRLRTSRLGERDFASDGASLFAVFCSACHGPGGEGREFDHTPQLFPALRNPVFLALADDEFLRRTIRLGRPGRHMPSWGKSGGLRPAEIEALVTYLRSLELPAPALARTPSASSDATEGRRLYAGECAPCHGADGEGSGLAPPLAARDNEVTTSDERIHGTLSAGVAGTAMGSFRTLDAGQLRAIIAVVRALPRLELSRARWRLRTGDPVSGGALYQEHCARCHEPQEGKPVSSGPGLLNHSFLAVASDGYLAGTIVRGRPGTKMPAFGTGGPEHAGLEAESVGDLVAFLRSKEGRNQVPDALSHPKPPMPRGP